MDKFEEREDCYYSSPFLFGHDTEIFNLNALIFCHELYLPSKICQMNGTCNFMSISRFYTPYMTLIILI